MGSTVMGQESYWKCWPVQNTPQEFEQTSSHESGRQSSFSYPSSRISRLFLKSPNRSLLAAKQRRPWGTDQSICVPESERELLTTIMQLIRNQTRHTPGNDVTSDPPLHRQQNTYVGLIPYALAAPDCFQVSKVPWRCMLNQTRNPTNFAQADRC